jgi:hypothetical protein
MGPFQIRPKTPEPQHEHEHEPTSDEDYSPKTRKYIFSNQAFQAAVQNTQAADASTSDIADLSDLLQRTTIIPTKEHEPYLEMSPMSIVKATYHWTLDKNFMRDAMMKEKYNQFRGMDMNEAQNRAVCDLKINFLENKGTTWERSHIQQAFKGYSIWAQLKPFELDIEEVRGMFEKVFVGQKHPKGTWARVPGSWWAARKSLFLTDWGAPFVDGMAVEAAWIYDSVEAWKAGGKGSTSGMCPLKSLPFLSKLSMLTF